MKASRYTARMPGAPALWRPVILRGTRPRREPWEEPPLIPGGRGGAAEAAPEPRQPKASGGPARYHHTAVTPDCHLISVYYCGDTPEVPAGLGDIRSRRYTTLHDDYTGNRILRIGPSFEPKTGGWQTIDLASARQVRLLLAISPAGMYAQLMKDEVFGVWHVPEGDTELSQTEFHAHCLVTSSPLGVPSCMPSHRSHEGPPVSTSPRSCRQRAHVREPAPPARQQPAPGGSHGQQCERSLPLPLRAPA